MGTLYATLCYKVYVNVSAVLVLRLKKKNFYCLINNKIILPLYRYEPYEK